MGRALAIAVFAIAAGAAAFAGAGLAVAPHVDPPGTPRGHRDHVLAAYRYPAFLIHFAAHLDPRPRFALTNGVIDLSAGLVLATLAAFVPRLPRPWRRPLARMVVPALVPGRDRAAPILGPPRQATLLLAT